MIYRVYVEKMEGFNVESKNLCADIVGELGITSLKGIRVVMRYDVSGITEEVFNTACETVFAEKSADTVYFEMPKHSGRVIVRRLLTGTYDRRADSAEQCIRLLAPGSSPIVKFASLFLLEGELTDENVAAIRNYLINPVESCEGTLELPQQLTEELPVPAAVEVLSGFTELTAEQMAAFISERGLAMSLDDAMFVQSHYKTIGRCPTITEIKVIDTYWSDHCRHTTFMTRLKDVSFENDKTGCVRRAWDEYLEDRACVYGDRIENKPVTLMDMATLAAKVLKKDGLLTGLDESEEINACSIKVDAVIDGKTVPYLVMFKNETHNHPTEIEPYGGAATCLGGAIRDPLSGRSYVYQAMRVTGCADPTVAFSETMENKLPQKVITTGAANGYSSYGNQIGLATGLVSEVYHEGYAAKRMEVGAVIAAAPAANVVRERPMPSDVVLLVGGRTGRDGCGGATGASKAHTAKSLETCSAEVQKGNPLTERKLQRLFRSSEAARLIKRCNDFGAGGVSVAVGELADGLRINLDLVPKKYEGLDGTELAISESQERMAVVVAKENADRFSELARGENLECTAIATVTDDARMVMTWRGDVIVDLERSFLDTNGVISDIKVNTVSAENKAVCTAEGKSVRERLLDALSSLRGCSQRGLVERFDSSIGASTVLMPLSGKYQLTPVQAMACALPADGKTDCGTLMSYGFDPYISENSPYHGAMFAVCESLLKLACAGGDITLAKLTFQEYFEKLGTDPNKWGNTCSALLGAYIAQKRMGCAAIGGKDSMSGTFKDIHVPPTLISFAVAPVNITHVISRELKAAGNKLYCLRARYGADGCIDFDYAKALSVALCAAIKKGDVVSASTVEFGGIMPTVAKMALGNGLGVEFAPTDGKLFCAAPCSVIIEMKSELNPKSTFDFADITAIGTVNDSDTLTANGESITLCDIKNAFTLKLENVFPTKANGGIKENTQTLSYEKRNTKAPAVKFARPRVLIPVFPGTNCEYDSARAFERAGALVNTVVIKNTAEGDIEQSITRLANAVKEAQILMLPGGFSAADEPDGSGKFASIVLRSEQVSDACGDLLSNRDGLMLGICNGFQMLIKMGLVPFGKITTARAGSPTLTYNAIGRHQSRVVMTRVSSVLSPWLSGLNVGDVIAVPISHGEGRFECRDAALLEQIKANGQVATQYVDFKGNATMDVDFNPAGSLLAVEGITSEDGRVFGKMGHSERTGSGLLKNVYGDIDFDSKIFESGVKYFS